MAKTFLLLGSNMGNRVFFLEQAETYLQKHVGKILETSSVYETQPWGFSYNVEYFLNKVIVMHTHLLPQQLLFTIKNIEKILGRNDNNTNNYLPRCIDIDILFYDNKIINQSQLTIPHKDIQNRMFVLLPLQEVAPDIIHPVLKKNITQLVHLCNDRLTVKKIELKKNIPHENF